MAQAKRSRNGAGRRHRPGGAVELRDVATHHFIHCDVSFPLGKITAVTGVSGSGNSSLVFDTLYGEAYRRYVESLSSFARQYLKALPKPQIGGVSNLPPAIAVEQTKSGATNRSTVGTLTELTDVLQIVFSHLARIECVGCGDVVEQDHPESMTEKILERFPGERVLVCAPLDEWSGLGTKELKAQLESQGFTRIYRSDGEVLKLAEAKAADLKGAAVICDRTRAKAEARGRLSEASGLALKAGRGKAFAVDERGERLLFSKRLECARCGIAYYEPSTTLFSFNHPLGACPECQGFGQASVIDWDKIIPDLDSSLKKKGVAPWNFGRHTGYYRLAAQSARRHGIDTAKPFRDYTKKEWKWLREGDGSFDGVEGYFEFLNRKKYKAHYRIHAARYRRYVPCPTCGGDRLNEKALACRVAGHNFAEVTRLPIDRLRTFFETLAADTPEDGGSSSATGIGVTEALEEGRSRLGYLERIGVSYLTLSRSSRTLSGGELQRIKMARCLGSALTDTLYCLDEPSCGLHPRDSGNLVEVIRELRDQGNTVVLVEHERPVIRGADHLIEIGPKAGHEGGEVVYAGTPRRPKSQKPDAHTVPEKAALPGQNRFLKLKDCRTHNLKGIDVSIPVGRMTAVCGVSGSGKSSLIQHTFYPLAAAALGTPVRGSGASDPQAREITPRRLLAEHREVLMVSQAALGRSSRSNVATYLGIMDEIRKALAQQPEAKRRGLSPSAFSFNTKGGRCETCRGLGTVVEDLSFLGDMDVICPACEGRRFTEDVLAVEIRGRNLIDILALTVAEAREFFYDRRKVVKALDLVLSMGMGYITLGQHTSSFSGGEAQRLKLLSLMKEVKAERPSLLIFDEPTTGLSDADVAGLLRQLRLLTAKGHTVIVVEHHLDVLAAADWLVEIGPEAADAGGRLVYEGPPEELRGHPESLTAPFLQGEENPVTGPSRTAAGSAVTSDMRH